MSGYNAGGPVSVKCPDCERCTWNPGPDCGLAEHPHCPTCGHCDGRHKRGMVERARAEPGHPNIDVGAYQLGPDTRIRVRWVGVPQRVQSEGDLMDERANGDETPVWELQPSDPDVAQCGECFALVLRAAMKAHEYWHDLLDGRA